MEPLELKAQKRRARAAKRQQPYEVSERRSKEIGKETRRKARKDKADQRKQHQ